jgi:translocation protein SEC63
MNCMTLSALLVQALWENSSPLLQLPYLKPEMLKNCDTRKKHVKSIKDLLDMEDEDQAALFRDLSEPELKNLISVAKQMPLVLLKTAEFKMLGQEKVHAGGGLVTCIVNLELTTFGKMKERSVSIVSNDEGKKNEEESEGHIAFEFDEDGNITEGGKVRFATQDEVLTRLAPVHSPYFPVDKRPGWWVVLMTRNMSHMVATPVRVNDLIDRKSVSFQFAAPPRPGKYPFTLLVRSDCMVGVDIQRDVDLSVVPSAQPPEEEHSDCCSHSESEKSSSTESESEE